MKRSFISERHSRFFTSLCPALAACLGAAIGSSPTVGDAPMQFQYHFETRGAHFPVALNPNSDRDRFDYYVAVDAARGQNIAALTESVMWQQFNVPPANVSTIAPFDDNFMSEGFLLQLSLASNSEIMVPEPGNDFWRNRGRRLHARTLDPTLPPRSPLKGRKRESRQMKELRANSLRDFLSAFAMVAQIQTEVPGRRRKPTNGYHLDNYLFNGQFPATSLYN
jgi:hypothetical protein